MQHDYDSVDEKLIHYVQKPTMNPTGIIAWHFIDMILVFAYWMDTNAVTLLVLYCATGGGERVRLERMVGRSERKQYQERWSTEDLGTSPIGPSACTEVYVALFRDHPCLSMSRTSDCKLGWNGLGIEE